MGRENLNTVAFQCNRKQKRENYGVQYNYIDSNAKIRGSTVSRDACRTNHDRVFVDNDITIKIV